MIYTENRKAKHDYESLENFEGGLELLGHEVKSIRSGGGNLTGAYVSLRKGELWLIGARVTPYAKSGKRDEIDPARERKILMRSSDIRSLAGKIQQKGLTLVPFSLYPRGRHIKLSFGLCRGRHAYDKKEKLKLRDLERDTRRVLRGRDVE